jgi:iron complex outermembrane receptor protein
LNLRPASSRNQEVGIKWRDGQGTLFEAALFNAETRDELAVARNVGGRSSFQNIASARRQGAEASLETPLTQQLSLQLSWTQVDATFRSPYLICVAAGCTVPNVSVAAGSRIPGVARHQVHAALRWQENGWNAALELAQMSDIVANDVATEMAPAYTLANIELGRRWQFSAGALRAFMRLENLAGARYIGSVIVNEGNGRFYESGIDRTVLSGVQWQWNP